MAARRHLRPVALGSFTALTALAMLTACEALVGRDLELAAGDDGGSPGPLSDGATTPLPDGASAALPDGTSAALPDGALPPPGTDAAPMIGPDGSSCAGANLATDGTNCGRCGHSCGQGACAAAVCQAFTLVDGQPGSAYVAVNGTSVYWSSEPTGQVLKAGKDGKAVTVLSFIQDTSPFDITIDDTFVYWGEDSTDTPVRRCAKTGCDGGGVAITPSTLANTGALAVDGTNVYVAEYEWGAVGRAAKGGGGALAFLATNLDHTYGVAADDASVFFSTSSIIGKVAATAIGASSDTANAGPYTTLFGATSNAIGLISAPDGNLYWAENNDPGGAVKSIPKAGSAVPTVFSANESRPVAVAVDDTNVYWTAQGPNSGTGQGSFVYTNGYVAMCPKTGCPSSGPAKMATGLHNPAGIAVDDTAVYVAIFGNAGSSGTNNEGSILKALK